MDLRWTEEQELLRETIRSLLQKYSSPEIVRELEDEEPGFRQDLWEELGRQGLLGLTIPEEHGGSGMSSLEQVILCEEFGRALTASPHFASCVLGARLAPPELLPDIATGKRIVTLAWNELDASSGPDGIHVRAAGYRLTGTKILVPFAASADALLVLARSGDGVGLFLTEREGVEMLHTPDMAAGGSYQVTFDETPATLVHADGWAALEDAMTDGLIALAAQAVGGAERAHEMAVEYAKERHQFGRPIGSFQGLAHPLAEMATEIQGAKVLVYEAAWARTTKPTVGPLAAMAKMYAADVFKRTTKVGQQVFGGIGFIRDLDMQLYFRRAKQLEITWLGPRELEERIARAELDTDTPFVGVDYGIGTETGG
ncbi:MAG: acyl-CoA dehydrogenase family protein [Actinomycetota bacterium]